MAHATDTAPNEAGSTAAVTTSRSSSGAGGDTVDGLLYRGESVLSTLDVGEGMLVATSHRVVALAPAGDARVRYCDRLNVDDVRTDTIADSRLAGATGKALLVGCGLIGAGLMVSFDSLLAPVSVSGSAIGLGGLLSLFSYLQLALSLMDDALLVGGGLSLAVGLAGLGWYLNSRQPVVRVSVVGTDDLLVGGELPDSRDLFAFRDTIRSESGESTP